MSDLLQRLRIRAGYELKKVTHRPLRHFVTPFDDPADSPSIIHCCYHKVGTVWFGRILRDVAAEYGLTYQVGSNYNLIREFEEHQNANIFLDDGSHVNLGELPNYVGSHMIRDPRDIVISGYFYHLWTQETWANLPRAEYKGRSYKQYLQSLSQDEGLLAEIRRVWFWVPHMADWNYNNPRMFEIKYETIISDEEPVFRAMFEHYGFSENAVDRCCDIAAKYSIKKLKKGTGTHIRSGRTGEWRSLFKPEHKQLFKELYPGALSRLGYETDEEW